MDENGTVSGGVDAQISVTASVDASGYVNVSRLDPTFFLDRVFGVLFGSPACGCRFGSGPGRFWVGVCRPWFCPLLCSVSVGSNSKKKRAPTPKPAVICDHFMSRSEASFVPIAGSTILFVRDFSSLVHHGSIARRRDDLVVYFAIDGSDGWRSPVPRGVNTGGEVLYFFRQPPSRVGP